MQVNPEINIDFDQDLSLEQLKVIEASLITILAEIRTRIGTAENAREKESDSGVSEVVWSGEISPAIIQ
jgi:hypothetical protein